MMVDDPNSVVRTADHQSPRGITETDPSKLNSSNLANKSEPFIRFSVADGQGDLRLLWQPTGGGSILESEKSFITLSINMEWAASGFYREISHTMIWPIWVHLSRSRVVGHTDDSY